MEESMNLRFLTRTIGRKLGASFVTVLILVLLVGLVGSIGVISIRSTVQKTLETAFQIEELAYRTKTGLVGALRLAEAYVVNYEELGTEKAKATYIDPMQKLLEATRADIVAIERLESQ